MDGKFMMNLHVDIFVDLVALAASSNRIENLSLKEQRRCTILFIESSSFSEPLF